MIDRAEAQNSMLQIVLLVLILLAFVFIFRRNANRMSEDLAKPVKSLARDMERVSHMYFAQDKKVISSVYEIAKIENSFSVMKATLQVRIWWSLIARPANKLLFFFYYYFLLSSG